jgi:hypothetical protein
MATPRRLFLTALLSLLVFAIPTVTPAAPGSVKASAGTVATYTIDFWNVDDIAYVGMNNILVFGANVRDPAPFNLTPRLTGNDDFIQISLYNTGCYNTSLDMAFTRTMNGVTRTRWEHFGPEWWGWNCGQVDKVNWTYRVNKNTGLFQWFNWNTGLWNNV